MINRSFTLIKDSEELLSFKNNLSIIAIQYTIMLIIMLEKTNGLGELIMMIFYIVDELIRFLITFGSVIALFGIIYWTMKRELLLESTSIGLLVEDLINTFNGIPNFDKFTYPMGKIFIMIFVYTFAILLTGFLIAMFINKYQYLWSNIDALKRMKIIELKNAAAYNRHYSAITITFFPISIIVLPFIPIVSIFKSEKISEFLLKL